LHWIALTESSVYPSHELVHHLPEVLVLLDIASAGHGHLDKHHLAYPLGVLVQENLQGVQLLRNTLDVIETINSDDELDALELFLQLRNPFLNRRLLQALRELLGINADREGPDSSQPSFILDAVWRGGEASASTRKLCQLQN
jgi:hypothetical protein